MTAHVPAKRLAGFYFAYYAAIGILVPYLGLYLDARGLTPAQIGVAVGGLAVTRIFAPYAWGVMADARLRRMTVILLTLTGAILCMLAMPEARGYGAILAALLLYGSFVNGTMGQFEVVTFAHLARDAHCYARIRVWGSIGFVVLVLGLGPVLEHFGVLGLPWWIAGSFAVAWCIGLRIPEPPRAPSHTVAGGSALAVATRPALLSLLLACLLTQLSYGLYYGFYSLYLEDHGYRKDVIGGLWALGVVAEIAVFWFIPRWLPRLSLRWLFIVSQIGTALRWVATPLAVDSLAASAAVQLLHAVSFAVYHLAAVNLIQRGFPPALQGRGQAIYIGVSYGIGGGLGGWAAGQLWARLDSTAIWLLAAVVAALGGLIAARGLERDRPAGMIAASP